MQNGWMIKSDLFYNMNLANLLQDLESWEKYYCNRKAFRFGQKTELEVEAETYMRRLWNKFTYWIGSIGFVLPWWAGWNHCQREPLYDDVDVVDDDDESGLVSSVGRALSSKLWGLGFKSRLVTVGGSVTIIMWGTRPSWKLALS